MSYAWLMVAVTFFTQFLCMGFTFYSFGVVLKPLAEEFGGGRFGVTLLPLAMSWAGAVVAPFVGRWVASGSIRRIMTLGCLVLAAGFLLGAQASALWQLGLLFGTLLTLGVNTMGGITAQALVVNWFDRSRTLALGISLMGVSLSGVAMAHVATWLVLSGGWRGTFEVFGWLSLCAAPVVWFFVVGRPEERRSDGAVAGGDGGEHGGAAGERTLSTRQAILEPNLWVIAVASGLAFMGTTAIMTHVFAFATDVGLSDKQAAWILSLLAAGAAGGKLVFGWLANRIGERGAFFVALGMQALGTAGLVILTSFDALAGIAVFLGLGLGGVMPLAAALLARCFGRDAFGPMMGLMTPIMIVFQSVGPPLAGKVFDATGSYDAAFWSFVAMVVIAAGLLVLLRQPPIATEARQGTSVNGAIH
jgi:cyanate permease